MQTVRTRLGFCVHNGCFLLTAAAGGYLAAVSHIQMGWLLGSLVTAAAIQIYLQQSTSRPAQPLSSVWRQSAQVIIALQAGQQINTALFLSLKKEWAGILILLFLSLLTASLLGWILSKTIHSDPITGLFALAPGGVSAIPGIAEELGANAAVVGMIQLLRAMIVALAVPGLFSGFPLAKTILPHQMPHTWVEPLYETSIFECLEWVSARPAMWTLILICGGAAGFFIVRMFRLPAALFIGSLLGIALLQLAVSAYFGKPLLPWMPDWMNIAAQVGLGASMGASFRKAAWASLHRVLVRGFWGVLGLILSSIVIAALAHWLMGIRFDTAILSFAPGGVAVMTSAAISLQDDPSFVAAVQTLRLLFVLLVMPVIFKHLHQRRKKFTNY